LMAASLSARRVELGTSTGMPATTESRELVAGASAIT
jgi:hypothetical protein